MVVSVSLSGESVSYSGIDGAGQRRERVWSSAQVPSPPHGGEIIDHPGCVAFIHSFIHPKTLRMTGRRAFGKLGGVTRHPRISAKKILTSHQAEGSLMVLQSREKGGRDVASNPLEPKGPT